MSWVGLVKAQSSSQLKLLLSDLCTPEKHHPFAEVGAILLRKCLKSQWPKVSNLEIFPWRFVLLQKGDCRIYFFIFLNIVPVLVFLNLIKSLRDERDTFPPACHTRLLNWNHLIMKDWNYRNYSLYKLITLWCLMLSFTTWSKTIVVFAKVEELCLNFKVREL